MPEHGLTVSFSRVIKVRHPTLVNISSTWYNLTKIGKWKKIEVLVFQKVAKTGNIGRFIVYSRYKLETVELKMS